MGLTVGGAGAHSGGAGPAQGGDARAAQSGHARGAQSGDTDHADEHAATERAIARFDRLSPAAKRRVRARVLGGGRSTASGKARAKRAAVDPPADVVGAWTSAPFPSTDYGMNASLLRGGRVLLFSMGSHHGASNNGQGLANDGQATIWDPALGEGADAFKDVDPPMMALDDPQHRADSALVRRAPLFCAGQVQLADGRILIAGGNLDSAGAGLKILFVFDPLTDTWVTEPDMEYARWYPTLTRMASGRVAILGGTDEAFAEVHTAELYPAAPTPVAGVDPGAPLTGLSTSTPWGPHPVGVYPHTFVLPSGRLSASYRGAGQISLLEPQTGRWVGRTPRALVGPQTYPTSFLMPGDEHGSSEIVQAGGMVTPTPGGPDQLVSSVYAIDPEQETRWRTQPPLNVARRNASAVLLPDGTAVVVDGGNTNLRFATTAGDAAPIANADLRRVELWNPATGTWTLGPASQIPRGYHSTGLLLADGRVLNAGDDWTSYLLDTNRTDQFDSTLEIYSPPYLFRGPRPQIQSAPSSTGYGEAFTITATADRPITRVTLVAPGSVTHAIDGNQRVLELPVQAGAGDAYTVTGPKTSGAAPPGDYMVFALNDLGVPSVAAWVRVRPSFPGQGTPVLTPLPDEIVPTPTPTATPAPGTRTEPGPGSETGPGSGTGAGPGSGAGSGSGSGSGSGASTPEGTPGPPATPTPVPAPPSSAFLRGRTVTITAVLTRNARHCPATATATRLGMGKTTGLSAGSGTTGTSGTTATKKNAARLSVATIAVGHGYRCRATGKLRLAAVPKASARITISVSGRGVQTLRVPVQRR